MSKKKPPNPTSTIADLIASMNRPLSDWQAFGPDLGSSYLSETLEESRRPQEETIRAATKTPALSEMLEASRRQLEETVRTAAKVPDLRVEYARIAAGLQVQRQWQAPDTSGLYESALKSITRATVASLDFKTLETMQGNHLRGLLQALNGAVPAPPDSSVERPALPAPRRENPPRTSSPSGPIPKPGRVRSRLTVFLATLPAFFEPPEHPVPKFRLH